MNSPFQLFFMILVTGAVTGTFTSSPSFATSIAHQDSADQDFTVLENRLQVTKGLIETLAEQENEGEKLQKLMDRKDSLSLALFNKYLARKQYQNLKPLLDDAISAVNNENVLNDKNLRFSRNERYTNYLLLRMGTLILNKNNLTPDLLDDISPSTREIEENTFLLGLDNKYIAILLRQIAGEPQDQFERDMDEFYDILFKFNAQDKKHVEGVTKWADDVIFENFPRVQWAKQEYQAKVKAIDSFLNSFSLSLENYFNLLKSGDVEKALTGLGKVMRSMSTRHPLNAFEKMKIDKSIERIQQKQWSELVSLGSKMFFAKNERQAELCYRILDRDFFDTPLFFNTDVADQSFAPFFFYAIGEGETGKKWMNRILERIDFKGRLSTSEISAVLLAYDFYQQLEEPCPKPEVEEFYLKVMKLANPCMNEITVLKAKILEAILYFKTTLETRKKDLEQLESMTMDKTPTKTAQKKKKKKHSAKPSPEMKINSSSSDGGLSEGIWSQGIVEKKAIETDTSDQKISRILELLENKTPWNILEALVLNHTHPIKFDHEVTDLKKEALEGILPLTRPERREFFIKARKMETVEHPGIKSVFDDAFIDELFPSLATVNFPKYILDLEGKGIFIKDTWHPLCSYDPSSTLYKHTFDIQEGDQGIVWKIKKDDGVQERIFYPLDLGKSEK